MSSRKTVQRAVSAIQKLYPTKLADKSWDNTGLLVDASTEDKDNETSVVNEAVKVLFTIDLTQDVAQEAIKSKVDLIMAYHPFIFRGLKTITQDDPQQKSLINLIKNNISVYSPHTAVDSAKGGVNDFLADGLTSGLTGKFQTEVIQPDPVEKDCGMGRVVTFAEPVSLSTLTDNIKKSLGISSLQVALARGQDAKHPISSVAICAGSGGGVFKGVKADLFYTGELSHHEALYFTETGSSVVACNHSNTERAFLKVFRDQLLPELPSGSEILISEKDADPFTTW